MTHTVIDPWDVLDPLSGQAPSGKEGTLLAVIPVPGTDTALAIVGYPVPASGALSLSGPLPGLAPGPLSSPLPGASHASRNPSLPDAPRPGGGVQVDELQRRAWVDGDELDLTFLEFELLAFLTRNPGKVFSRGELLAEVWAQPDAVGLRRAEQLGQRGRTVDVHISRLRRKLGPAYGHCLITEFRIGYQFTPSAAKRRAA
jgi:DNA-binding winged helix-turn-helix (wHTH) protein